MEEVLSSRFALYLVVNLVLSSAFGKFLGDEDVPSSIAIPLCIVWAIMMVTIWHFIK